MPTLAVGMWHSFRVFNMPTASVGMAPDLPHRLPVRFGGERHPFRFSATLLK